MAEVVVDDVTTAGTRLSCTVTPSRGLRRYFTGREFYAEYDRDVSDVPAAIAAVPPLAQVCPVAWANGADVRVPVLDRRFHRAVTEVRDVLTSMYPEFVTGGEVRAGRLTTPDPPATAPTTPAAGPPTEHAGDAGSADPLAPGQDARARGGGAEPSPRAGPGVGDDESSRRPPSTRSASRDGRTGILFSGGVDSMASYVRHRAEAPALISVQGWVVDSEDASGWERTRERLARFAAERDLDHHVVRSNMLRVLDMPMLQATYQRYLEGAWYSSVGHGLGLLGLCAPLTYAAGIGRLYIAATHWDGSAIRWGSRPVIDERVRWTGTTAVHDGYELTRQERVDVVAEYVREGHPDLTLRTCNEATAGNCGRCEKCARTIVGLLLAGLDPTDHGYPIADDLFEHVRERFRAGDWVLSRDELLMWRDIREHAPDDPHERYDPAVAAFLEWLEATDLAAAVARARRPLRHRLVQAIARNTPTPVYERVYPVYAAVR